MLITLPGSGFIVSTNPPLSTVIYPGFSCGMQIMGLAGLAQETSVSEESQNAT